MKISKKDQKLLLYTFGIITLLLVYVLIFLPATEKISAQKQQGEQLEQELAAREAHAENQTDYETKTKAMQTEMDAMLSVFPADVRTEDILLYADVLEQKSDMKIANISIAEEMQKYSFGKNKQLKGTQAVYTFTVSYDDLKRMVKEIQNCEDKRNVENLILSFDSASGKIIGSMNVNFYFLLGTDKEYESPASTGARYGTDNIFGTVKSNHSVEDDENEED